MLQHWRDGTGDTTKLIVVTDEAPYAQSLPVAMAQRQVEELAAGKSPATVFGADATHVVLRSVSHMQYTRESAATCGAAMATHGVPR